MLKDWELKDFDPSTDVTIAGAAKDKEGWVPIAAPGDVYVALRKAGRIPDPFMDENEHACAWVRDREWRQRTTFDAPALRAGERLVLTFNGLDTYARVFLNGALLGRTDNMFRAYEFDITDQVRKGANDLLVAFTPTGLAVADKEPVIWPMIADSLAKSKRNLIRKAQFGWGWDWGPDLPTVGVWKSAELKVRGAAWLDGVQFQTHRIDVDKLIADVEISATVKGAGAGLALHTTLLRPNGSVARKTTIPFKGDQARESFKLENAALWWTNDLGEPELYTLKTELRAGEAVLDRNEMRVGVRTIALDTSPDPDEPRTEFFRFILNGVPIFARGACWIPASSFVGALTEADYRPLIERAVEGNMNMLRIWGGGIYEHEAFYDLCDALGVLVWQDFMFACAPYPQDEPQFVESVRDEVRQQIKALRHHPSIALWCGNNEVQAIHSMLRAVIGQDPPPLLGALYFDEMMPDEVRALDPTTPYWPGSPWGGPSANSMRAGDVHDWTVWHGVPPIPDDKPIGGFSRTPETIAYTRYAEDMARFVSEFGIHASPALETLKGAMAPEQVRYGSAGLAHRIKDHPKDKVNGMLVSVTGLPETIDQYVDFTQITQAEGLKFGIEHFRRRMPHCSGTLIWQFNDCWPCVSWSVVDFNGYGKAGFYYVRRVYAPVLASFRQLENGDVELWVTNETQADVETTLLIELGDLHDGRIWAEDKRVKAPAYSSAPVWRGAAEKLGGSPRCYLRVESGENAFPINRHFFAPIKDIDRVEGVVPKWAVTKLDNGNLALDLEAPEYLIFVHALYPDGGAHFSDNHFDMKKGERRRIEISGGSGPLDPARVSVRAL